MTTIADIPRARVYGPAGQPLTAAWRSGAALRAVRGDFGSVRDAQGRNQFSPFLCTLIDEAEHDALDWVERWQDPSRRYTHAFFAPEYGYPSSPIGGRSFTAEQFVEKLRWVLDHGISPVIWLADEPSWAARGLEIVRQLKAHDLLRYVIVTPGCEPVVGAWDPHALDAFMNQVIEAGGDELVLGIHTSPHRFSYARSDEDEKACFYAPWAGRKLQIYFYQMEHGRNEAESADGWQPWRWRDFEFAANPLPPEEEDRLRDGLYRLGQGHNGWPVIPICISETVLFNDYRHEFRDGEAYARRVASRCRAVAAEYGVTLTYLNGCPDA